MDFDVRPASFGARGSKQATTILSIDDISSAVDGPFQSLNYSLSDPQRRALGPFHLLVNEEASLRGMEPTIAIDTDGRGSFEAILGPLLAVRAHSSAGGGLRYVSLREGDEARITVLPVLRSLSTVRMPIGDREIQSLLSLMPHAATPGAYGEANFKRDINFSPIVSDLGSLAAARAILHSFGRSVTACYFGSLGSGAFKVYLVFDPSVVGAVSALYRRQE